MTFFEHQDRARKNTQHLVGLFLLSLLLMIVTIYLIAVVIFAGTSSFRSLTKPTRSHSPYLSKTCLEQVKTYPGRVGIEFDPVGRPRRVVSLDPTTQGKNMTQQVCPTATPQPIVQSAGWWNPTLFVWVAIPTILIVGGGSWLKTETLKQGGSAIAQELGGRLLLIEVANPAEQQLLNVVEEMAIASGVSVPYVYLLDHEDGINAFAAGYSPNNAVIGVTRGCLDQLTRDELQGVIGHEFSHILNGDMRLNLKLVGMLHGILMIYIAGRVFLSVRSNDNRENAGFWLFGVCLVVIGSLGLLCGRLIKSAVSRQREFLADASAVQFTRNPTGLAGALDKIADHHYHSFIRSPHAEEHSHLFFGSALRFNFFEDWFATHPPLEQRIRRLQAHAGRYASAKTFQARSNSSSLDQALVSGLAGGTSRPLQINPAEVVNQIGTVSPEHFAYAHALIAQLPELLQLGIQNQQGAIAIVYALLLETPDSDLGKQQVDWLRQIETKEIVEQTLQFHTAINALNARARLPLLDLTVPALRQASTAQCQHLFKCIKGLAMVDGKWSLSEFVVQVILWHRLQPQFQPVADKAIQYETIDSVWSDCLILLSAVAEIGHTKPDTITYAFRSGLFRLPEARQQTLPDAPLKYNLSSLKQSLNRLEVTAPKVKQAIVEACAHTVLLDNKVTTQEADLLRTIAILLDCPLPPFLKSYPLPKST
jgi:Zn-dependent protease with chaperone function